MAALAEDLILNGDCWISLSALATKFWDTELTRVEMKEKLRFEKEAIYFAPHRKPEMNRFSGQLPVVLPFFSQLFSNSNEKKTRETANSQSSDSGLVLLPGGIFRVLWKRALDWQIFRIYLQLVLFKRFLAFKPRNKITYSHEI